MTDIGKDWKSTDVGWIKQSEDQTTSVIRKHKGMWRLARIESWLVPSHVRDLFNLDSRPIDIYDATDIGDCVAYDSFLDRYATRLMAWVNSSFDNTLQLEQDGYSIRVAKKAGNPEAFCYLRHRNHDLHLGLYKFELSKPQTCFIADQWTINGHSFVQNDHVGKGFGRQIYDAAETISGMTALPSGRDFAPGELSADSKRFWERRSVHTTLPTSTSEAAGRRQVVAKATELTDIERKHGGAFPFVIALADLTGGRPFGIVAGGVGDDKMTLWVELPDGRWMNSGGLIDNAGAKQIFDSATNGRKIVSQGRQDLADLSASLAAVRAAYKSPFMFSDDNLIYDVKKRLHDAAKVVERHLGIVVAPELSAETLEILSNNWDPNEFDASSSTPAPN